MTSKAITEHPETKPDWQPAQELAPSDLRADEPTAARWVGLLGLTFLTVGIVAHLFKHLEWKARIDTAWGTLFCFVGAAAMLYHAARDSDGQVRRTYGLFGFFWLVLALVVTLIPAGGQVGSLFLPWGVLSLAMALLFLLPFTHHETEPAWRERTVALLGLIGAALALVGLVGGNITTQFLVPHGLVVALLGLCYLCAFITFRGSETQAAYRTGVAMALVGFLAIVFALARWLIPWVGYLLGWNARPGDGYFGEAGFLVVTLGLLYLGTALALCSDNQFVVLTRRELASFFYSPIAYLVLFGFFVMATWRHLNFAHDALGAASAGSGIMEPVVWQYIWDLIPVIIQVVVAVPLLTMRLFAEEKRSGTFEVLFTAPVPDLPVVLSKFVATLIIFLATWLPYGLYLLAFRIEGGQPFDYRPLESFVLALIASGMAFIGMGLFFSSITRNQIAAGVLTAMGVLLMIGFWGVKFLFGQGTVMFYVFAHLSFIDLWSTAMQGRVPVGDLVLQASLGIFWLFLTLKVLEARKWS